MSHHLQKESAQAPKTAMTARGHEVISPKSILLDARPEAIAQRKLQSDLQQSPQVQQAAQLQSAINQRPQVEKTSQLQARANAQAPIAPVQRKENKSGLPGDLQAGIEQLSGIDMSDVRVHYNSAKPAQVQAHAYAQGSDIHLAPGQEQHLPHEAWHVAQQKQGRVKATEQIAGMSVNTDTSLEKEADTMGEKAMQLVAAQGNAIQQKPLREVYGQSDVLQSMSIDDEEPISTKIMDKKIKKPFEGRFDPKDKDTNRTLQGNNSQKGQFEAQKYIDSIPSEKLQKLKGDDVTITAQNPEVIKHLCIAIVRYDNAKTTPEMPKLGMKIDYKPETLGVLGGCHDIAPIFGYLLNVIHQSAECEHEMDTCKKNHSVLKTNNLKDKECKYIDPTWRQNFTFGKPNERKNISEEKYEAEYGIEHRKKLPPVKISDDFPSADDLQTGIEKAIDALKHSEKNEKETKEQNQN
jgi:Domain of unknown function (DUF4157)